MSEALILTAAVMGLAGLPHCGGMCGAACAGVARGCGVVPPVRAAGTLLLGRALGYAAAGAAVASLIEALRWLADIAAWLQPFWLMLQLAWLGLGIWLLWRGRLPWALHAWIERLGAGRPGPGARPDGEADGVRIVTFHRRVAPQARTLGIGLLWGLLPCGLLHGALLVASVSSSPAQGALVMTAFAATSSLGLWGVPWLAQRWLMRDRGLTPLAVPTSVDAAVPRTAQWGTDALTWRLAGASVVAMVGMGLWHRIGQPLYAAWCA